MNERTPTPWNWDDYNGRTQKITGVDKFSDRVLIAKCESHLLVGPPTVKANAAFIVKACNAHDDLVAALKNWLAFCDALEGKPATRTSAEHMEALRHDARAALAKAGVSP